MTPRPCWHWLWGVEACRERARQWAATPHTASSMGAEGLLPTPRAYFQQRQLSPPVTPQQRDDGGTLPSLALANGGGSGRWRAGGVDAEALPVPKADAACSPGTMAECFPATIGLPAAAPEGRLHGALLALRQRTGVSGEHLALALQLAVAIGAASTLHVCPTTYEALQRKTIWVVVTGE